MSLKEALEVIKLDQKTAISIKHLKKNKLINTFFYPFGFFYF